MQFKDPSIDNAVKSLRPNVITWQIYVDATTKKFLEWNDPTGSEPPTWEELSFEIRKLNEVWNYYEYARKREEMYGDIKDQLDMLYHDIKSNNLESGSWITHIDKIKSNIKKPKDSPPDVENWKIEDFSE